MNKLNLNGGEIKPNTIQNVDINGTPRQSENDPFVVLFDGGQEITNNTVQKDGTFYDIDSLDIESYNGKIYSNHEYGWQKVLGWVIGLEKDTTRGVVTISGIRFSRKNPLGELARDMALEGIIEFSTGTTGTTDDDGRRADHRLIEISIVGLGNNDYTMMDNSLLAIAAKNGIDLAKYNLNEEKDKMKFKVKNSHDFKVKITLKNEAGEDEEKEIAPGEEVEVADKETQERVQGEIDKAEAEKEEEEKDGEDTGEVANEVKELKEQVVKMASALNMLKKSMNTPAKAKAGGNEDTNDFGGTALKFTDKVKNMSAGERLYNQIKLEREGRKLSDEYRAINEFNMGELVAKNAMDDSDGSLGGLIPPYELLDKIAQASTKYDNLLSKFGFENDGLSYGWNLGIGDIEFTPLAGCNAPSPQSGIETEIQTRTQERLATHSVICNKVSRFSPVNILNVVAGRYQGAYRKALAQFLIAELQVAVDSRVTGLNRASGTDIDPDASGSLIYPVSDQAKKASVLLSLFTELAGTVLDGTYIMNYKTAAKLILDLNLGVTGIMSSGGTVAVNDYNRLGVALGGNVLVVPNDLMPTLGTDETFTVTRTTPGGGTVVVDHAIFYAEPQNWRGVTNGPLSFDIDSFGSYEVTVQKSVSGGSGGTVTVTETRSAKQRGETVLFGEMFRGGGIFDFREVGGIKASTDESPGS